MLNPRRRARKRHERQKKAHESQREKKIIIERLTNSCSQGSRSVSTRFRSRQSWAGIRKEGQKLQRGGNERKIGRRLGGVAGKRGRDTWAPMEKTPRPKEMPGPHRTKEGPASKIHHRERSQLRSRPKKCGSQKVHGALSAQQHRIWKVRSAVVKKRPASKSCKASKYSEES